MPCWQQSHLHVPIIAKRFQLRTCGPQRVNRRVIVGCCTFSINPSELQISLVKSKARKQVRSAVPTLCLARILDKEIRGRHMSDSGKPNDAERVLSQFISHLKETRISYRNGSGMFCEPKMGFIKCCCFITGQRCTFKEIIRNGPKKTKISK